MQFLMVSLQVLLLKLQEYIGETLEKVSSRETYVNSQLDQLLQEYQGARAKVSQVNVTLQDRVTKTDRTRLEKSLPCWLAELLEFFSPSIFIMVCAAFSNRRMTNANANEYGEFKQWE